MARSFQVWAGFLQDPTISSAVSWRDITGLLLDSDLSLVKGAADKTSLFNLEVQNVTFTLNGDFGGKKGTDLFTLRTFSPIEIIRLRKGREPATRFRGLIVPDGLIVDEEMVGYPETRITAMSYVGFMKDAKLGTIDVSYRRTADGERNRDPNEFACLYVKKGPWDVPGVTTTEHPAVNNAEVALTPSDFNAKGFLLPGDVFAFERRFIFDSRMLSDGIHTHTNGDMQSGECWKDYTYNGHDVSIRFTEFEDPFYVPVYTTPATSLISVMDHLCNRMTKHFDGFPFFNSVWPRWIHPYKAVSNPLPNLVIPGEVPLNVGRVWHYRYLYVNSQEWLIVWHTQFEVEVFFVENKTTLTSCGSYVLPSYLHVCNLEFYDYYLQLHNFGDDSGMFLSPIWSSPNRRTDSGIDTSQHLHPDWEGWDNLFCVVANRFIVFGNMRSVYWHGKYHDEHQYQHVTNFAIAVLDTQDHRLHTRTDSVLYGTSENNWSAYSLPAIQKIGGGEDWYYVPVGCSGCRTDTVEHFMEDVWDSDNWDYEAQHVNSAQEVGNANAVWTDGTATAPIVESTPVVQRIQNADTDLFYKRVALNLNFLGDIALDSISFSFENMNCGELLTLLCTLTDTIPVFDIGVGEVTINLLPRCNASATTRTLRDTQLLSPVSREQYEYIESETAPNTEISGLNLSEQHKAAINAEYQKRYFLRRHEMSTTPMRGVTTLLTG
jgi:hypothetical protein